MIVIVIVMNKCGYFLAFVLLKMAKTAVMIQEANKGSASYDYLVTLKAMVQEKKDEFSVDRPGLLPVSEQM